MDLFSFSDIEDYILFIFKLFGSQTIFLKRFSY